jgi:hypothetical protein
MIAAEIPTRFLRNTLHTFTLPMRGLLIDATSDKDSAVALDHGISTIPSNLSKRMVPQVISSAAGRSSLQETAVASPCTPCKSRSTRSRRFAFVRAGCRSRWTGSPPFSGRVPAGSAPHRCGFWPSLSTGIHDRRSKLTLPPWKIGKPVELSKKLVKDRLFWLCQNCHLCTLAKDSNMPVGFRMHLLPSYRSFVQTPL